MAIMATRKTDFHVQQVVRQIGTNGLQQFQSDQDHHEEAENFKEVVDSQKVLGGLQQFDNQDDQQLDRRQHDGDHHHDDQRQDDGTRKFMNQGTNHNAASQSFWLTW
jgi:hypothetical protein